MEHATFTLVQEEGDAFAARSRTSYDMDFHAWALHQAELIRLGRFDELDVDNLVDEVADMAHRVRKELVSRLCLVVQHLLKWDFQRDRRSASWARTIREQRIQVQELLDENRSLGPRLGTSLQIAFRQGRVAALNETGLLDSAIPEANPYTWDDLMTRPIAWPEP